MIANRSVIARQFGEFAELPIPDLRLVFRGQYWISLVWGMTAASRRSFFVEAEYDAGS